MSGRTVHRGLLSGAAYAGMFVAGIVMALLGAVLPLLAGRLHFGLAQAGNLFVGMNFAMLASMLALGPLMDRFGIKLPLAAGALAVAAALVRIAGAGSYGALMAGVVLLGLGGGALNGGTNTLVADLHADPRRKSSALNILGIFFGFGALFIPFVIGALLETLGLARILYIAMALSGVLTVVLLALAFPAPKQGQGFEMAEALKLARNPVLLLLGFLLFFQSGNEFIVGGYVSSYLTGELGSSISVASYLLAAYWGALMATRILSSRLVLRVKGPALVLASALITAAGVVVMLASRSEAAAASGIVLIGVGFASIYPVALGFAGSRYEERSGTAFGILFSIALTGGMTMPWAVGQISAVHGLRRGLLLAAANALMIFVLQLFVSRAGRRR